MSEEVQELDDQPQPDSVVPLIFGRLLKRLRAQAGMERAELGRVTGYSAATIASYEQGRRIPNAKFIVQADEVLDAKGALTDFVEEMEKAQYPAFFQDAAVLEKKAMALHVFAVQGVPGLLQTEDYARAVFTMWRPPLDGETIEQRVMARLARQELLTRKPAPTLTFVLEEAVVRKQLGGSDVWRGQLERILLDIQRRNVEIQVLPDESTEHASLTGPFTLIETMQGRRMAYVPAHKASRLYSDRATVRELEQQYSSLRAQALSPLKSLAFIEKLLGET
ncbi:helix-turn-helix domain-containing protein [Streptomyces lavenduligriseus]|uniref:Helix-turn-helix domain-containing protein n=1 Tax=Streptomyces lavenduligriseus TaxID=67315 RepID=A0ABT0NYN3_9ACTN|nr:helix-turn-helix transcriptional regulator [Streptomyces lavenduligriseus]MCL3995818.1 helix-turn-helix domain-containing protein [Streptomyces lavenduligriseus]